MRVVNEGESAGEASFLEYMKYTAWLNNLVELLYCLCPQRSTVEKAHRSFMIKTYRRDEK